MEKEEFVKRFKAALEKLLPYDDYVDGLEYIEKIAPTYWDDPDQRADGPEECAESEAHEWGRE